MSTPAWCDLKKQCTVLKLNSMCYKLQCSCQKQITFTLKKLPPDDGSIKTKLQKIFKGTQAA